MLDFNVSFLASASDSAMQNRVTPFSGFCFKVLLPAFFFLMQFDPLISNILPVFFPKFGKPWS